MKKILASFCALSISLTVSATPLCQDLFPAMATTAQTELIKALKNNLSDRQLLSLKQKAWSQVKTTDPKHHKADDFTYIVHSLNSNDVKNSKRIFGENTTTDLILNPQDISKMGIISASLINQSKAVTYGIGLGLILKIPAENLMATREVDLQSFQTRSFLESFNYDGASKVILEKYINYGLSSPEVLLQKTPNDYYNELLVLGSGPAQQKVKVVGYFIKTHNGINALKLMGRMAQLEKIAADNNLPIVIIDGPEANVNRLADYPEWQ